MAKLEPRFISACFGRFGKYWDKHTVRDYNAWTETQLVELGIFNLERGWFRNMTIFKYMKDWQVEKGLELVVAEGNKDDYGEVGGTTSVVQNKIKPFKRSKSDKIICWENSKLSVTWGILQEPGMFLSIKKHGVRAVEERIQAWKSLGWGDL